MLVEMYVRGGPPEYWGGGSFRLASALSTSDIEELLLISVSDDGDGQ